MKTTKRLSALLMLCLLMATGYAQSPEEEKRMQQMSFLENFYWWEQDISKKPYSWYRSEKGLTMAENILSWQNDLGGWPLMNTADRPFSGDSALAGPWGMKAALIKATLNEIRFLARAYGATGDETYRTGVWPDWISSLKPSIHRAAGLTPIR